MRRRFPLFYLAWISLCVIAFVALRGAEDPSRRHGRILSNDAAVRALAVVGSGYQAVHVGYAKKGEAGSEDRWIVLCDHVPHTELREAVVVELRASDGSVIGVRRAELGAGALGR